MYAPEHRAHQRPDGREGDHGNQEAEAELAHDVCEHVVYRERVQVDTGEPHEPAVEDDASEERGDDEQRTEVVSQTGEPVPDGGPEGEEVDDGCEDAGHVSSKMRVLAL